MTEYIYLEIFAPSWTELNRHYDMTEPPSSTSRSSDRNTSNRQWLKQRLQTIKTDFSTMSSPHYPWGSPQLQAEIRYLSHPLDGLLLSVMDNSVPSATIMRGVEFTEQAIRTLAERGSKGLKPIIGGDAMTELLRAHVSYHIRNRGFSEDWQTALKSAIQEKIDKAKDTGTAVCSSIPSGLASQQTLEAVTKVVQLLQAKYEEELAGLDQGDMVSTEILSYDQSRYGNWNEDVITSVTTEEDSRIIRAALDSLFGGVAPVHNPSTEASIDPFKRTGRDLSFSGAYYK